MYTEDELRGYVKKAFDEEGSAFRIKRYSVNGYNVTCDVESRSHKSSFPAYYHFDGENPEPEVTGGHMYGVTQHVFGKRIADIIRRYKD